MGQATSSRPHSRPDLNPNDYLSRLPFELLTQILSHIPTQQLTTTALVSFQLSQVSNLLIYRDVSIGWKEPDGVLPLVFLQRWKPEKRVKAILDNLTAPRSEHLVKAIRRLSVANYERFNQRKMDQLELILIKSHHSLRQLEFVSRVGRAGVRG